MKRGVLAALLLLAGCENTPAPQVPASPPRFKVEAAQALPSGNDVYDMEVMLVCDMKTGQLWLLASHRFDSRGIAIYGAGSGCAQ